MLCELLSNQEDISGLTLAKIERFGMKAMATSLMPASFGGAGGKRPLIDHVAPVFAPQ
jgi:hypothetical protein